MLRTTIVIDQENFIRSLSAHIVPKTTDTSKVVISDAWNLTLNRI